MDATVKPLQPPFQGATSGYGVTFLEFPVDNQLHQDITDFFKSISHLNIDDSCTKEGLRQIIVDFKDFIVKQNLIHTSHSFEILLNEKGSDDPFRSNNTTPNLLHEIRNCAHALGLISIGLIPMESYFEQGGLDTDLSGRLRHDSIEDKGETKRNMLVNLINHMKDSRDHGLLSDADIPTKTKEAELAATNVDSMSRKDSKINLETGEITKKDRYDGNIHVFHDKLLEHIFAFLGKNSDGIENIGTRYGGTKFTLEDNIAEARKRRNIYGLEDFAGRAIEKWPDFIHAINATDNMFELQLTILEGVNMYMENEALDPTSRPSFRLGDKLVNALIAFQNVPECFHPVSIAIHSLRAENNARINAVLDCLIIPPIRDAIKRHGLEPIAGIPPALKSGSKINHEI